MYFIANWKLNHNFDSTNQFVQKIANYNNPNAELVICPQSPLLPVISSKANNIYKFGAQNLATEIKGAYTGEISVELLNDFACSYVIIGHSERRTLFHEKNDDVAKKVKLALDYNISPILCVGETKEERENNKYKLVIKDQLESALSGQIIKEKLLIAYEPVWSIGTGLVPTNEEINEVFKLIYTTIESLDIAKNKISILYGGSANLKNLDNLLEIPNIGGFLIGSASLDADNFLAMANFVKGK